MVLDWDSHVLELESENMKLRKEIALANAQAETMWRDLARGLGKDPKYSETFVQGLLEKREQSSILGFLNEKLKAQETEIRTLRA